MHEPNRWLNTRVNVWVVTPLSIIIGGIICLGMIMAPSLGAQSETVETTLEFGSIDWSKGVIRAKGLGVPPDSAVNATQARAMAKRAARIVAYERLLELVEGIQVDSQTLVKNYMVESEVVNTEVKGIVKGARVVQERPFPDGSFEVTVEMRLNYLDDSIPLGAKPPDPVFSPDIEPKPKTPAPKETNFTGLVINAQGLELRECMFPKIVMEDGQVVFAREHVSPELKKNRVVGYVKGLSKAQIHDKVKDNPLMVKAVKVANGSQTDLVINEADAQLLYLEPNNLEFLRKAKVVIAY